MKMGTDKQREKGNVRSCNEHKSLSLQQSDSPFGENEQTRQTGDGNNNEGSHSL